jgi:hypothetical protein
MLAWLLGAGLGPAAIALPVNWAADALAGAAQRWFKRLRRADDLSRLVRAATGTAVALTPDEFDVVRNLLQDAQTWTVLGKGTVDDLAVRIAACLPERDGRTSVDAHSAALTIARGLLEFAVADLDPSLFQQVLLARLDRMETDQASALDEAMFGLHADLIAGFASLTGELKRLLDRLPPGPAGRGEIAVYLRTLIDWVNTDPWPQHFGGPALAPADIERKLRLITTDRVDGQELSADDLAERCQRLVILGAPGSGKTWLAKRAARRCAEEARQALAAGATLDEVELPLYTTCSRLQKSDGDIRGATVSSALDQLGDLGGSRISTALRVFFSERNAPTLVVIDSLDEAHGASERLRQAGTLPWRIVLTSRQSSWRKQLPIRDTDSSHRVSEIQPLLYPHDVEPFIEHWFSGQPEHGERLAAQIRRRPDLQQAVTVPLILAFYCILGGSGPLPEFRHDLYARVLKRILIGRWRGDDDCLPDVDACLQTLRAWAWSAAVNHHVSGVGMWADDVLTERARLSQADSEALDHIAMPMGLPDIDTGKTPRRFIHRTIREHLVAVHISTMPAAEAAEELLPHLWFDRDWEYSAPAALAMHADRDQVLREIIRATMRSDELPGNLAAVDGCLELRRFLARLAAQSSEADWSAESAGTIGHALMDLVTSETRDLSTYVRMAQGWGNSNGLLRTALLQELNDYDEPQFAGYPAEALAGLHPTVAERAEAREKLLQLLSQNPETGRWTLVDGLAALAVTAEERRETRNVLLALLTDGACDHESDNYLTCTVLELAVTPQDRAETWQRILEHLLERPWNATSVSSMAGAMSQSQLELTVDERDQAIEVLLRLTPARPVGQAVVRLAMTAGQKQRARSALLARLARETRHGEAGALALAIAGLDPDPDERRHARESLLTQLRTINDPNERLTSSLHDVDVGKSLALLTTAELEREDALRAVLGILSQQTCWPKMKLQVRAAVALAVTAEERRQVRAELLVLHARRTDSNSAWVLGKAAADLTVSAEEPEQHRQQVLGLLTANSEMWAPGPAAAAARLAVTAEERRSAVEALLKMMSRDKYVHGVAELEDTVAALAQTAEERATATGTLLQADHQALGLGWVYVVTALAQTPGERQRAREKLLELIPEKRLGADVLAHQAARLADSAQDRDEIRATLLTTATESPLPISLIRCLVELNPTQEERRRARQALVGDLTRNVKLKRNHRNYHGDFLGMAQALLQLDPTPDEKRKAKEALLWYYIPEQNQRSAARIECLVQLGVTERDLARWPPEATPPELGLIAAVRKSTKLSSWLAILPTLTRTTGERP